MYQIVWDVLKYERLDANRYLTLTKTKIKNVYKYEMPSFLKCVLAASILNKGSLQTKKVLNFGHDCQLDNLSVMLWLSIHQDCCYLFLDCLYYSVIFPTSK
jgi:hypothetical protein